MSKVITFSRVFPSYHPKAGQPTYFVEKVLNGLINMGENQEDWNLPNWPNDFCASIDNHIKDIKYHTIRAGNRFKPGDKFSPRVWSGKPYRSPQIIIAPDIEVVKTWEFEIDETGNWMLDRFYWPGSIKVKELWDKSEQLAKNDGLTLFDFHLWFNKLPFKGQIICWNKDIIY